jgi:protein tyrosine phosphatase (PTP) superfamily phosphohydrolase (DUF442 family)
MENTGDGMLPYCYTGDRTVLYYSTGDIKIPY